jgi:hypothetical protein
LPATTARNRWTALSRLSRVGENTTPELHRDESCQLAILQKSVDEANQRLKVAEALERQAISLLLTPEGLRAVDPP